MRVRLWLGSCAMSLSIVAALAIPASMAASTSVSASSTTTTTAAISTTTCSDGHWPASVQGVPTLFHAGARGGDYIWHDARGWHLRVTHAGTARVVFSGRIVSSAPLDAVPVKLEGRDYVALSADRKVITYRMVNYGRIDGFDFRTACAQRLTFTGNMAGSRLPTSRIWIGHNNRHPLQNPFIVTRVS
jgi:hypothetical protein